MDGVAPQQGDVPCCFSPRMSEQGGGHGTCPRSNQTAPACPTRFRTLASGNTTDRHGLRTRGSDPPTGAAHSAVLLGRRSPAGSARNHSRRALRMKQVTQSIRAAIYARVSSDQQTDAGTIASQVAALEERLQRDDLALDPELRFIDEGYSGSTLVRPALERLRDATANGAIDRLYVHSPDRLARKYAYQVLLVDEFQRCSVELVFLNRELGRSPEDDLLLQVQGMVAEYERATILERSRRGKRHAAQRGSVNVLSGAPMDTVTSTSGKEGGQHVTRSSWRRRVSSARSSPGSVRSAAR